MSIIIKNGLVVDPLSGKAEVKDILIEKSLISKLGKIQNSENKAIDATGKIILPGLIDMHTHLRVPGREDEETILSGSQAAVKGGFTTIMCMPNTNPVIDSASVVDLIKKECEKAGLLDIFPVGAITKDQAGKEFSELAELKEAGCLAISEDGMSVENSHLMRRAMEYAKMVGLLAISHCEDKSLSASGLMHEDIVATKLGLKGIPDICETIMVARDIELARFTKSKLHFAHISAARSLELIRRAKKDGVNITAETCPHYIALNDEAVKTFNTNTKINPPLRAEADRQAIIQAIKDGIIDLIFTDHAPHNKAEKELEYNLAPFGTIGLETALAVVITELVENKIIDWLRLAELMSLNPAKRLGLKDKGFIKEGIEANLVIVDPGKEWIVKEEDIVSKSKNSVFMGMKLKGSVEYTIFKGRVVFKA
ncbi:MAG: dihydroorotase [Candidatus Omnitrophica bacterium]|nr:dihydroorotase [Candidatus Omnitrophota bacterium]